MNKLNVLAIVLCIMLSSAMSFGMHSRAPEIINAISTGQSTGVIGHLYLTNSGDTEAGFSSALSIIKPIPLQMGQLSQAYLVEPIPMTRIPANGDTTRIAIFGYCLDISKPPVPFGTPLPLPADWLATQAGSIEQEKAFTLAKNETWPPQQLPEDLENHLGRPFSISYDCYENPGILTSLVFPLFNRLEAAYRELDTQGEILTPYRDFGTTQYRTVIQYCLWVFSSALEGKVLTKQSFDGRLRSQFAQRIGVPVDQASEQERMQFQAGVDDLWHAFEITGRHALSIDPERPVSTNLPAPESTDISPAPECICMECDIKSPWKFAWTGFLEGSNVKLINTMDTFPYGSYLQVTPPVVSGVCDPDCEPRIQSGIIVKAHDISGKVTDETVETGKPFRFYLSSKGSYDFIFSYTCQCEDNTCKGDTIVKTIISHTSNACCESIRESGEGQLVFQAGNGQFIRLTDTMLTMHLAQPEVHETFNMPFNIEAVISSLDDSRAMRLFDAEGDQRSELKRTLLDRNEMRNIALSYDSGSEGMNSFYHLNMQLQKNEMEFRVILSLDRSTCQYDVSVFSDGRFMEYAQPLYDASGLFDIVFEFQDENILQNYYWNQMLFFGLQFMKGLSADPGSYNTKYQYWKGKLENALRAYIGQEENARRKAAAETLREVAYNNAPVQDIVNALMQFIDQFHDLPSG